MANRYDDLDDDLGYTESKQQSFFFFSTVALATTISILGIVGGFIYGDYYGRKHAQYENPELRQYYAGQCFPYLDTQLKKSIRSAMEKGTNKREENERLDDIRNILMNMQLDIGGIGQNKKPTRDNREASKKKVASITQ